MTFLEQKRNKQNKAMRARTKNNINVHRAFSGINAAHPVRIDFRLDEGSWILARAQKMSLHISGIACQDEKCQHDT
jgi:hypothetical protein